MHLEGLPRNEVGLKLIIILIILQFFFLKSIGDQFSAKIVRIQQGDMIGLIIID